MGQLGRDWLRGVGDLVIGGMGPGGRGTALLSFVRAPVRVVGREDPGPLCTCVCGESGGMAGGARLCAGWP